ncbi:MAG: 5'-3' exonuclease H3TH domain-containing protein, partial [Clostridia bacterium]
MTSNRLLIIDGNSIMNRAFYGIMSSKTLMSADGTYTNAIYGFLAILFKELEDLQPDYIAVAFDLKAPTHRHKMFDGYKATRHGMPDELAQQMPIIKEILKDMNITIIEKEGYEADDVIGTISKQAEKAGHAVTILSGDRDNFQLASNNITIRIPRTKMGKTETEDYNEAKIEEEYGVKPIQLIEVKGLMGDTSDNIPGVPGVGEKTALKLIKEYENIDKLYQKLENNSTDIKGTLKEKLENNKELAMLSKTLGTILVNAPLDINVEDLKTKEWNKEAVTNKFKELKFNRFIERFDLNGLGTKKEENKIEDLFKIEEIDLANSVDLEKFKQLINYVYEKKEFIYYMEKQETQEDCEYTKIINQKPKSISIYNSNTNTVYYMPNFDIKENTQIQEIFKSEGIAKFSYKVKADIILLKELKSEYNNLKYDAEIAGYILNSTDKNTIQEMSRKYLDIDIDEYLENEFNVEGNKKENAQINLFDLTTKNNQNDTEKLKIEKYKNSLICYSIAKLIDVTTKKLEEVGATSLFNDIEMPLVPILAEMQYNGMYVDKEELKKFGDTLKEQLNILEEKNKCILAT